MTPEESPTSEQYFRAAVESSPAGMVMVDEKGKIVLVNREIERMFGWGRDELMGETIEVLVPQRFRSHHPGFRSGFFHNPDARPMGAGRDLFGLRKDGTEIPVEIGLNPIETEDQMFVLSSIVDISERKREEEAREHLERQLRQVQKMDAVGTLAGGIAHDFNNILGAILGFAELLEDAVEGDQARSDLKELVAFTQRGKSLVEKIQAFGKRQEGERHPLSLEEPVGEVRSFLRSSLPPNVTIETMIDPDTPRVLADASAIHQLLMNLGVNAGHAMPDGGRLSIRVEPLYVTDNRARAHPSLREGHHAIVSIQDTGVGIDREIQGRVFEPFFTTKAPGQGSGLGLAIVHGIVRGHGGALELESATGTGTVVRVILPAVELGGTSDEPMVEADPRGNGERILYVDDEPGLGTVGKRRLERLGYRVALATDGDAGLARFREDPEAFDVVISDYLMPGMNGLEFSAALHALRPDLPIVLLTGFVDNLPEATFRDAGVRRIVRKPATTSDLAIAVADALNRESSPE